MDIKQARKQIAVQRRILQKALADFNAVTARSREILRAIERDAGREERRYEKLADKAEKTKDYHKFCKLADQFDDLGSAAYAAYPTRITLDELMG